MQDAPPARPLARCCILRHAIWTHVTWVACAYTQLLLQGVTRSLFSLDVQPGMRAVNASQLETAQTLKLAYNLCGLRPASWAARQRRAGFALQPHPTAPPPRGCWSVGGHGVQADTCVHVTGLRPHFFKATRGRGPAARATARRSQAQWAQRDQGARARAQGTSEDFDARGGLWASENGRGSVTRALARGPWIIAAPEEQGFISGGAAVCLPGMAWNVSQYPPIQQAPIGMRMALPMESTECLVTGQMSCSDILLLRESRRTSRGLVVRIRVR